MLNQQKPEKPPVLPENYLSVHSKWTTIQGEGLYSGYPASFIRLAGCNLQCPLCDTDYTSKRNLESVGEIVQWIEQQPNDLVVLTGGEPFLQPIAPLARAFRSIKGNRFLQIETNGVSIPKDFPFDHVSIVCSPKTSKVSPNTFGAVDAWKYVLKEGSIDPLDGLPTSALGMSQPPARPTNSSPIFVQPCDDKDVFQNKKNLDATVQSCLKFGYRLCIQIQKIINLP